ncbi:flavin reductase family protein [Miltoncostaea marina]|uniref:flavin reductase family protein n=1 Tax=Miltoncostaea marina TaxID=2843215 RepID=UPI001C3C5171|nr:flavin reductase family protein [Miltoncostaea marina]
MGAPVVHWLVSRLDYPMFIVTVRGRSEPAGCLVGFTTQCSIHPPRFLVCISERNHTFAVAREAEVMVVHMVPEHATALAELFGSETGDEVDKFARCRWTPGPMGTPVLDDLGNWFAGRIIERLPAGDHTAYVLEPVAVGEEDPGRPFTFHRARRIQPGHPP